MYYFYTILLAIDSYFSPNKLFSGLLLAFFAVYFISLTGIVISLVSSKSEGILADAYI
jgi:hypothetical protein